LDDIFFVEETIVNQERQVATTDIVDQPFPDLWRRQCARNVMDCYALVMDVVAGAQTKNARGCRELESLARLMVDGMTAVKNSEDEKGFYRAAAAGCRECAAACAGGDSGNKARLFRIYAAIFEDLSH
jgi:hypothetical protein